ncbi:MAG: methyltransferase [Alphaproteobacteria bacterium]|jgi:tRNA1(Val) A37 N6-methylase TrmN6|nr:methyltransferase [Alphaproteobacteria bacterium]
MTTLALLGGRLPWLATAPRPTEDARWLAAAVPPLAAGSQVLDVGCGSGMVGLVLALRTPGLQLWGVELQPARVAEARCHAAWANVSARLIEADALTWRAPHPFPVVVSNPPFHAHRRGHHSPNPAKALAHGLPALAPWLQAIRQALAPGGAAYVVLHASLQAELLDYATPHGGTLQLRPLASHPARPPKRLLACWRPNLAVPCAISTLPVVPAYHTPLREAVLRDGACLGAWGYGW